MFKRFNCKKSRWHSCCEGGLFTIDDVGKVSNLKLKASKQDRIDAVEESFQGRDEESLWIASMKNVPLKSVSLIFFLL